MKCRGSPETRFPKVSRRSEPCLGGKRPFEVSKKIFDDEKRNVGNRLKRVFPKFEAERRVGYGSSGGATEVQGSGTEVRGGTGSSGSQNSQGIHSTAHLSVVAAKDTNGSWRLVFCSSAGFIGHQESSVTVQPFTPVRRLGIDHKQYYFW